MPLSTGREQCTTGGLNQAAFVRYQPRLANICILASLSMYRLASVLRTRIALFAKESTGWPRRHDLRVIPLAPIWSGFVVDWVFYTCICFLLWMGLSSPLYLRRRLREIRGKCLQCGYDLRGAEHDVCPECGVVV